MASDAPAAAGPSTAPATPKKTTSKNSAAQFLSEDDGVRIRIHNLPVDVTDEQLLQLFGPFGSINHVYVVLDNSSRPLAAYIAYAEAASATAAMEHFDGKVQLEGAPMELYITPAQDSDCDRMGLPHLEYSRLYYHGFPADSAFQDLLPTFQRFGRVCSLVMSTGVRGTVTMGTKEQAVAVIEGLDNTPVEGGKLRVHWAEMKVQGVSRPPGAKSTKGCINNCTIRYSGVPRAVPPTDVATVFGRYGPVLRVSPHLALDVPGVKDSTDRCGLVVMATEEGAKEAMAALNTHFIWPGATGPLLVARLAAPPPAPAGGSTGAASSSKAGSGTSSGGGSVVQVVKRPVPPPAAPPPANKGPGAGRGGPSGPPPYANGHGPANGHGYPPYGAPGGYYGGAPYGGGYYGPYSGPPHMMGPQGYGPRPPPYGPWPSVPPPGAPYGGYPPGRGPMPPPPPGGWRNGYGGLPEGGGMGGPVTYVVDAATGQQKPAYQLADGRLLIAPTGTVTVPPAPGGTPPPPPPPAPPAGPSPPPPQPPSQPPPPPSQPAASAPTPAQQQQPAPPPPPSPPKPAPAAPVVSAPQAPEQQPPAQPQPAVVQQQAQVVQQQLPQQQQPAPAMQQQQQQVHAPQQTVVQPQQQQQQQAPVVQQQQLQQQQLQQAAPAAPAVLSGSQGGVAPPGDVTGTLFTARPHTASVLQPHAHALAQPVQQTGSPIHHQQHAGQQQQVLAAAAPPQQAGLGLHAVASTRGYMIHSTGMAVAGLQQPLTLSMAPCGGAYMTYDAMQGHQAVQQQQQQPLRYLTAMGGDTLSYAAAGGPPGLDLPTATTSMAVAFGHGAGGLGEQQLGAGAMYAGDSLGHVYVLT